MIHVSIANYKSIAKAEFDILPLTILVGPPNGGKSNIMEALSLIGLMGRFIRFTAKKSEPDPESIYKIVSRECGIINPLLRTSHCEELFYYSDVTRTISISLKPTTLNLNIKYGELRSSVRITNLYKMLEESSLHSIRRLRIRASKILEKFLSNINQLYIYICLYRNTRGKLLSANSILNEIVSTLNNPSEIGIDPEKLITNLPEVRLYGYERFGVNTRINEVMSFSEIDNSYKYTLAEDASNITLVLNSATMILDKINEWLESLGAALKVIYDKRKMELLFLKDSISLTPSLASDAVLRMIYYLSALRSAIMVKKIYNVETNIIMLEEPGAHVFPYSFDLLGEAIKSVVDNGINVIISTHNNLLVSKLWDLLPEKNIATYYVYEKPREGTILVPLPLSELAKKFITSFDVLSMKPTELLHGLNIDQNPEL